MSYIDVLSDEQKQVRFNHGVLPGIFLACIIVAVTLLLTFVAMQYEWLDRVGLIALALCGLAVAGLVFAFRMIMISLRDAHSALKARAKFLLLAFLGLAVAVGLLVLNVSTINFLPAPIAAVSLILGLVIPEYLEHRCGVRRQIEELDASLLRGVALREFAPYMKITEFGQLLGIWSASHLLLALSLGLAALKQYMG